MKRTLSLLFVLLLAVACGDYDIADGPAVTIGVENITSTSATLIGFTESDDPFGFLISTDKDFDKHLFEETLPIWVHERSSDNYYAIIVTDLTPNTTYYFAASILPSEITELGAIIPGKKISFKTKR